MIKVKKTDSIVDIIIKMKDEEGKEIILDFPFGHTILHNYTSLKILKTKAEEKDLIISTNDITAKKIGKKLGIKYSITSNEDVIKYNYNFWEYLVYTVKSYFKDISEIILDKGKDNTIYKYHKKYGNGKISYFLGFLIISILLLFFVFYFAVNKTYIYIKPEIEVKDRAKNFIFKEIKEDDSIEDENIIKIKKITNTVNLKDTFGTSGATADISISAKGKIIIYNLLEKEISLIKNTRFQTKEGQVFLLEKEAYIEGAKKEGNKIIPGKKEAKVIARLKDDKGNIIGKKGNIKSGIKLSLPGLKSDKDKIYAFSNSNFSGGNNNFKKVLTKEDLENAKKILRGKLEKLGLNKLKQDLSKENKLNNVQFSILDINGSIIYDNYEVTGLEKLKVGEQIDKFDIFGTIKTTSYIYNKDILLDKLKTITKESILDGVEKLSYIDDKSLKIIWEINRNDKPFQIKATVQIEGFFTQNFLNNKSSYIEKLKNSIAGKTKQEAEKILINNKKISNAKIKIRPFFIKNVSKLIENIEFIVEE